MLKLLSEFLHSPGDFFQDERRQRIVIISLFSLLFVCVLFSMVGSAARQRNASGDPDASPTPMTPAPTQTKWWVRHKPSETPTSLIPSGQASIGGTETLAVSSKCPAYAADFKPGTFGYISLFPPYENLVRSGAGKNYSTVGFIEIGGWVKILAEPVCAMMVCVAECAIDAGSSNWTAGGHKAAQWIIPCPDPNKSAVKEAASDRSQQHLIPITVAMVMTTIQMPAYQTSSPLVLMRRSVPTTCWLFAQNHLQAAFSGVSRR
jgi:hypothetical protein